MDTSFDIKGENELEIINCLNHRKVPNILGKRINGNKFVTEKVVVTKLLTDGQIVDRGLVKVNRVNDFSINGEKIDYPIDTLVTEKVKIINASYIIKIIIAKEYFNNEEITEIFNIIKDIQVYADNKEGLNLAKKNIENLKENNCLSYAEKNKNIYRLVLKKIVFFEIIFYLTIVFTKV